jgi:glycosyltransferase involved in cell wall biosynthesis
MTSIQPLVSVCVPSYNSERTIERCLNSILAQDLSDAEIVLVDNCSTDRTCDLATACLRGFPRARVVRNPSNAGRVGNWNRCIDEARGTFIKFMFTNDVLMPGGLQRLLRSIAHDGNLVMAASSALHVSAIPESICPVATDGACQRLSTSAALEFFAVNGFRTGSLNGMIYRKSPIAEHGIRFREDIPYFADFFQAIELAQYGGMAHHDVATYYFDAGATDRYHFVGMQDPRRFFIEHRQCTDRLAELLHQHRLDAQPAYKYLTERYLWYLGQGTMLTARDAWQIFRGRSGLQLLMAARTYWFNLRQRSAAIRPASANDLRLGVVGADATQSEAI